MQLGLAYFPTDYSADIRDVARAAEDAGYDSLFVAEHSHIPVSRQTPYPGGGELPRQYEHTLDPFVALTAAACVTERLKVGTGVCLVMQRDPIHTAKESASLDLLSGGRFLFGVGGGWNREEMADHGTDPRQRWEVLRERIGAIKVLWTQEVAEFHGSHVEFAPTHQWPKPVQRPHPPVLVGGSGSSAIERVLDYGDGWMPISGRGQVTDRIAELQRRASEQGRDAIPVTIYACRPDADVVRHYGESGVDRCVFMLPSRPAEDVLPLVREWAALGG